MKIEFSLFCTRQNSLLVSRKIHIFLAGKHQKYLIKFADLEAQGDVLIPAKVNCFVSKSNGHPTKILF